MCQRWKIQIFQFLDQLQRKARYFKAETFRRIHRDAVGTTRRGNESNSTPPQSPQGGQCLSLIKKSFKIQSNGCSELTACP